jgi:hypothetical protein
VQTPFLLLPDRAAVPEETSPSFPAAERLPDCRSARRFQHEKIKLIVVDVTVMRLDTLSFGIARERMGQKGTDQNAGSLEYAIGGGRQGNSITD